MWTLPNGTFEWLEICEPITYFPSLTRISFHKGRNIILNILIIILMLTLKSIKMRETAKKLFKILF